MRLYKFNNEKFFHCVWLFAVLLRENWKTLEEGKNTEGIWFSEG